MSPAPNSCVLFVLAFGPPRPFHRLVISNWSRVPSASFVIITDSPRLWSPLLKTSTNIQIVQTSIEGYFSSFYPLFKVSDSAGFMARFGNLFFGKMSGWTACGLRPLLRLLFHPKAYPAPLWGWIDYDVLLDGERFAECLEPCLSGGAEGAFFTREGIVWEQLKVFRNDYAIAPHYGSVLQSAPKVAESPLEAHLSYYIRDGGLIRHEAFQQEDLCAHWTYTDGLDRPLANLYDISVDSAGRLLRRNGGQATVFLADTECLVFTEAQVQDVTRSWHEDIPVNFPHIRRPA